MVLKKKGRVRERVVDPRSNVRGQVVLMLMYGTKESEERKEKRQQSIKVHTTCLLLCLLSFPHCTSVH